MVQKVGTSDIRAFSAPFRNPNYFGYTKDQILFPLADLALMRREIGGLSDDSVDYELLIP